VIAEAAPQDAIEGDKVSGIRRDSPRDRPDNVRETITTVAGMETSKHGIRFTAMPSFAPTLQDEQIWKIAMFLKRMDKLPPPVDAEWKKVPSVAAPPSPK
jgi:hypothetical protein